jgi:hypothetical protein
MVTGSTAIQDYALLLLRQQELGLNQDITLRAKPRSQTKRPNKIAKKAAGQLIARNYPAKKWRWQTIIP